VFGAAAPAGTVGSLVGGLFQEGGKIATGAVNVFSSFLTGNLNGGTTGDPYGQTYHPQQRRSQAAPTRVTNYGGFYGHDTKDVMQELNVRDAQQQSFLANYG
jgi:hypothetical protein